MNSRKLQPIILGIAFGTAAYEFEIVRLEFLMTDTVASDPAFVALLQYQTCMRQWHEDRVRAALTTKVGTHRNQDTVSDA